jgi:hypothetical protein
LIAALWFGSAAFLLAVAAPAAFRASDGPTNAANVVGAMLAAWHYLALILPLLLLALEWRRARAAVMTILSVAIIIAALQVVTDIRIRAIRAASPVPITELAHSNPIRRRFGLLHGISSLFLLGQVLLAGAAVAVDPPDTKM